MKREIVYDLTEVHLASTGKLRYYGIARVVAEIATKLFESDRDIRFAIFSQHHNDFFEVTPSFTENNQVDLGVPSGIREFRLRRVYRSKSFIRDVLLKVVRMFLDIRGKRLWDDKASHLKKISLDGKTLVSCGRPKLIVDMVHSLDQKGVGFDLIPLVHDLIPLHDLHQSRGSFAGTFLDDNKYLIVRSKILLTNSAFTKQEFHDFAEQGVLPPLPDVYSVPLVHEYPDTDETSELTLPQKPYILAVGTSLGRKNLEVVFNALKILVQQKRVVPYLVLAGARRKRTDAYLARTECDDIRDFVLFRENPNQADLKQLYENAEALVLPSRIEGWGLPAGEALWLGTPALCAAIPVLREVCGDLGLYFDPDKPDEFALLVDTLLSDPEFAQQHRRKVKTHNGQLRTWQHVANDLLQTLEKRSD